MSSLIPHWRRVEEKDKKNESYFIGTNGEIVAAVQYWQDMKKWYYEEDGEYGEIEVIYVLDPKLLLNLPKAEKSIRN